MPVTIALDAMGSDHGPAEVAQGAALAAAAGTRILLVGPRDELSDAVAGVEGVEIAHAPDAITNHDEPARAVRSRPQSSVVVAARAVAEGRADALVSAGATGATLAAALFEVRRIEGVHRPALGALLPLPGGTVLLLDAGANTEAKPEHLVQFALMGSAFSSVVLGTERPRVGLLSVGEEAKKGTPAVVEANRRLVGAPLNFAGNIEGRDVMDALVDVAVTDGFTGNVALKVMEATARMVTGALREAARSSPLAGVGGMLLRPKLQGLRDQLDPETTGGAILLGLRGVAVVAHGSATRRGIANAIALAERGVHEHVVERTAAALAEAGALRGQGAGEAASAGAASVGEQPPSPTEVPDCP